MPAPQLTSFRRQTINSIFIGIDFGTSYTKVSYSYAPSYTQQIETIQWENEQEPFFKQTVLFIQNGRLYFENLQVNQKKSNILNILSLKKDLETMLRKQKTVLKRCVVSIIWPR